MSRMPLKFKSVIQTQHSLATSPSSIRFVVWERSTLTEVQDAVKIVCHNSLSAVTLSRTLKHSISQLSWRLPTQHYRQPKSAMTRFWSCAKRVALSARNSVAAWPMPSAKPLRKRSIQPRQIYRISVGTLVWSWTPIRAKQLAETQGAASTTKAFRVLPITLIFAWIMLRVKICGPPTICCKLRRSRWTRTASCNSPSALKHAKRQHAVTIQQVVAFKKTSCPA
mmetsp:Transcript_2691/g.5617  ORF Transcript_2691/g.5617 Transcript_2691/m.5617 type:complete len:224 (+) Transcript_2691:729-1400(+)